MDSERERERECVCEREREREREKKNVREIEKERVKNDRIESRRQCTYLQPTQHFTAKCVEGKITNLDKFSGTTIIIKSTKDLENDTFYPFYHPHST